MQLLVRTPSPHPTESLFGYVLRISEENGYSTPWHILVYAGMTPREMRTAGFPVRKLATVLRKNEVDLEPIAYCVPTYENGKSDKKFKILGHSLGAGLSAGPLRLAHSAFCPLCVRQCGYVDAFWDLTAAVACPTHKVTPLRTCSACGQGLNYFRPGILRCKCGAYLGDAPLEPADEALSELMGVLRAVAHGSRLSLSTEKTGLPIAQLCAVPFLSLLAALTNLGVYALAAEGKADRRKDMTGVMMKAAQVLTNWPVNYHELLAKVGSFENSASSSTVGLCAQFQGFYSAMFRRARWSKDIEFLKEEFIRFGQTVWGKAIVDRKLLRESAHQNQLPIRFMTLAAAARQKGIRPITLKRWIAQGLLSVKTVQIGKQQRYIVDSENFELSEHKPGQSFGERMAAAHIGMPVAVLNALRKSGDFAVRHIPQHKPQYHQADLDSFKDTMLKKAPATEAWGKEDEPAISLDEIFKKGKSSGAAKAAFISAYLNSDIKALRRTGAAVGGIAFRLRDAKNYFFEARSRAIEGALTLNQTAKLLGFTSCVIPALLSEGYLKQGKRLNRVAVCPKSAAKFSESYVGLGALANELGTSPVLLTRICNALLIRLTTVSRKNGRRASFVNRTDESQLRQAVVVDRRRPQLPPSCVARVKQYLNLLAREGKPLPLVGRKLNKFQISRACGVDRKTLSMNQQAIELIENYQAHLLIP